MDRLLRVFIHPPKAGGVSTTDALKEALPGRVQIFPRYFIDREIGDETDIAIGHLSFGCHKTIRRVENRFNVRYLTQLRDPVDRAWSHWNYLVRQGRMEFTLIELLGSDRAIADNLMTRQLSGMAHSEPVSTDLKVTDDDLRQAKYNIAQHFDWIGVLDYYRASMARLSLLLEVDLPVYRHNTWAHRHPPTEEERAALEANNQFDIELYRWVKSVYYP